MFSIAFTQEPLIDAEPGENGRVGLLNFGGVEERFVAHLGTWSEREYSEHWRAALVRTLNSEPSALITDMQTPQESSHLVWWPMWKVGNDIVFHNQIFFFSKHGLEEMPDLEKLFKFVEPRQTHNSKGMAVSEWLVPVSEIRRFLNA
jgi:hypothetical protein